MPSLVNLIVATACMSLWVVPAHAEVTGQSRVNDGDTIEIAGERANMIDFSLGAGTEPDE